MKTLQAAGLLMGTWESIDNIDIDHVAGDSRKVGPNGLFVAIRGVEVDGHLFIDKAVKKRSHRDRVRGGAGEPGTPVSRRRFRARP